MNATPNQRDFVPIAQAARLIGVPVSWLSAEARANRVPAVQAGRRVFVHLERTRAELAKRAESEGVRQ